MIRKTLALIALLLSLVVVAAPAASAAGGGSSDYADCIVTVDPSSFDPGATVTVHGEGLEPNFTTTIEFNSVTVQVGSATTDATGAFTAEVTIPSDATEGAHTISAVCDTAGNVSSTDVTVSSTAVNPPGGPLPRTGSDGTEPLVVVGVLALLAGVAFVVVAKRRRQTHVGV
jgi:alpha-L-fucosidase